MGMDMSLQKMDMNTVMYPEIVGSSEKKPMKMDAEMDHSNHAMASDIVTLNYGMLKSPTKTVLANEAPVREMRFELTGNMNRYVWSMDNKVLSEVDKIIQMENSNREDFAKAAFQFYITQKKKLNLKETMIKGYKEMGRINLSLAELGMTDEISLENDSKGDMAKVE